MTNVLTGAGDRYYVYRPLIDLIGLTEGTDKGRGYNETLAYGRLTGGHPRRQSTACCILTRPSTS